MRIRRALALSLLSALPTACESASPTSADAPPAALVGLYKLDSVQGEGVPAEIVSADLFCDEREPFRNPAGPRLNGDLVAAFFDGTLELGTTAQRTGRYVLSLSVRTTCTFGDGGHQELEDQVLEEGGFLADQASETSWHLRMPLTVAEGYTHLLTEEPLLGTEEEELLLRARVNGVDMVLRFRKIV